MALSLLVCSVVLATFVRGEQPTVAAPAYQGATCNSTSLEWARLWGSTGSGTGQFRAPAAVAVDREGYVHVVDRDNQRIQRFDWLGGFQGEYGNEDGRVMINPNGIEVGPNGYMYIADSGQHRILYYNRLGSSIGGWNDSDQTEWRMLNPWGVAGWDYDYQGNVYVVDRQTGIYNPLSRSAHHHLDSHRQ